MSNLKHFHPFQAKFGQRNEKGANPTSANPLFLKCRVAESNHGHEDFQSSALPTELTRHPE